MKQQLINQYGLNDSQADIVLNSETELIVPAGAGSGKTKTLVTKVIHLIKNGANLDNFLVLTFTNKAALEMKERIKGMLKDEKLFHLVNKVDSANISTFDSFAYNFVKQNGSAIGLSSNIELLDNVILNKFKNDFVLELVYEIMANSDSEYFRLLTKYTRKNDESVFVQNFLELYESLIKDRNLKDYENFDLINKDLFFESLNFSEDLELLPQIYIENNSEKINSVYSYLNHLKNNTPYTFEKISHKKRDLTEDEKKLVDKVYIPYRDLMNKGITYQDLDNYYIKVQTIFNQLLKLLLEFDKRLTNFKVTNNKYEFRDIASFLNEILINNPDVLERLKNQTEYIFVDEYQDTSEIQSTFLNIVIKDNKNVKVLYVGDIKQSIYKFRDAKPETFINKQKEIKNISLDINYRSSKPIIDFVNNVFSDILTDETKHDIIYRGEHEMKSGSQKYINDSFADVYLIEANAFEGKKNPLEEAFIVGNKIKELIASGVTDKYNDFAIIAKNSLDFKKFSDVFDYLGIPIQIQRDVNLKQTYYFKLIANILNLSLNLNKENLERFKFDYFSLLRSELVLESDFKLYQMFVNNNFVSFNETNEIYQKLERIRNAINTMSNYQIIQTVINEFNVYEAMLKAPKAFEKTLQIDYLLNIAEPLNELGIVGSEFVEYIKTFAYSDDQSLQKILLDKDDNSVKVINIHQSKGLEYPIVFFVGLEKGMSGRNSENFEYLKESKFIAQIRDDKKEEEISKVIRKSSKILEAKGTLKEELRLLYTAITRAERAIYLLGVPKDDYSELKSYNDYLYYHQMKSYIKPENIINIDDKVSEDNYFLKLKEENIYFDSKILEIEEKALSFPKVVKEEVIASSSLNSLIDDNLKDNLYRGTILHERLEYGNLINKLLEHKFFEGNIRDAILHKELPFYLEDNNYVTQGIIDLVIEFDYDLYIVDYKTYDIDPSRYGEQLNVYEKYLKTIYPSKKISKYLYSIVKNELIKVGEEK